MVRIFAMEIVQNFISLRGDVGWKIILSAAVAKQMASYLVKLSNNMCLMSEKKGGAYVTLVYI